MISAYFTRVLQEYGGHWNYFINMRDYRDSSPEHPAPTYVEFPYTLENLINYINTNPNKNYTIYWREMRYNNNN